MPQSRESVLGQVLDFSYLVFLAYGVGISVLPEVLVAIEGLWMTFRPSFDFVFKTQIVC